MYKKLLALMVVASVATPLAVQAGSSYNYEVQVGSNYAYGVLSSARNSADSVQYIGCSTTLGSYSRATCTARDANSSYRSCYTQDADKIALIGSISANSWVYFVRDDRGQCSRIIVKNESQYLR